MSDPTIPSNPPTRELTFHFIKSSAFRAVHCDGVFGGPSPNGRYIHMSLFNERTPIPLQIVQELDDKGKPTIVKSRTGREGVTREVEIDVIMNLETAKGMLNWLTKAIENYDKRVTAASAAKTGAIDTKQPNNK